MIAEITPTQIAAVAFFLAVGGYLLWQAAHWLIEMIPDERKPPGSSMGE